MAPIIEAEHLSKQYRLGSNRHGNDNLREHFIRAIKVSYKALRRSASSNGRADIDHRLWALRDINLQIATGESVGFIGTNGAGKSTLLKILSRITDPTEGKVRLRGTVASLLEIGTGFHPELTGRENIFLNGAILGMKRAEIRSRFDEIVAFSELEKFLDMPVKHYSSGMYVRLGFAIAAHLNPQILVVDEVLAVGDMAFQKKCVGKMADFGRSGRTVLFVSHNMAAVENLCERAIVLQKGRLIFDGSAKQAVQHYIRGLSNIEENRQTHAMDLSGARRPPNVLGGALRMLEAYGAGGTPFNGFLPIGGYLQFHVHFHLDKLTEDFDPRINFTDVYGNVIFAARCSFEPDRLWSSVAGDQKFVCEIPSLRLTPGEYRIGVGLVIEKKVADYVEDVLRISVIESDYYGTGTAPSIGACVMEHHWRKA